MTISPHTVELQKAAAAFDYAKAAGYIVDNLLESIDKKGAVDTMALFQSVNWKLVQEGIMIQYNYYGMFVDMGVTPHRTLSEVRNIGKGKIKDWYTPTIHREIARLAQAIAEHTGTLASAHVASVAEGGFMQG